MGGRKAAGGKANSLRVVAHILGVENEGYGSDLSEIEVRLEGSLTRSSLLLQK